MIVQMIFVGNYEGEWLSNALTIVCIVIDFEGLELVGNQNWQFFVKFDYKDSKRLMILEESIDGLFSCEVRISKDIDDEVLICDSTKPMPRLECLLSHWKNSLHL